MKKNLVGKDHEHPDGQLMGAKVTVENGGYADGEYTVTGLQSGTAVITRADGYQRHKPIYELRNR